MLSSSRSEEGARKVEAHLQQSEQQRKAGQRPLAANREQRGAVPSHQVWFSQDTICWDIKQVKHFWKRHSMMASLAKQGAEAQQAGMLLTPLQLLSPRSSMLVCIR